MIEEFVDILNHALLITGFVFSMMLFIEYLNVLSQGKWQHRLKENKIGQIIFGVILGAVPGCLGTYTVVTLYSHGVVSFGALVATMIATSGDEAFVMLSLFPIKAIILFALIGVIGFLTGFAVDILFKMQKSLHGVFSHEFEIHKHDWCDCAPNWDLAKQNILNLSFTRALLIGIALLLLLSQLTGGHDHEEWGWIDLTLVFVSLLGLFIVLIVPEHFLEEHLWEHVVKKHLLRIFLWTFGALLFFHFIESFLNVEEWIQSHYLIVLFVAVLIGFIPESGPHLIFVTLFASGSLPFSILLASSIVQDGHGALPLIAFSKKGFLAMKLLNIGAGIVFGLIAYLFGF